MAPNRSTSKNVKAWKLIPWIPCILLTAALLFVSNRAGYVDKVLERFGIKEETPTINLAVESWRTCLEQLDIDADIVFFGDSITNDSNFQSCFPDKKIVNLGYSGDSIVGMKNRVSMLAALSPEKVFILGGINSLRNGNNRTLSQYRDMISAVQEAVPKAQIIIQSILPISAEKEKVVTSNKNIQAFNTSLCAMADEMNLVFIDLYPLYESNGCMNPDFTKDGIHLKSLAYCYWEDAIRPYVEK